MRDGNRVYEHTRYHFYCFALWSWKCGNTLNSLVAFEHQKIPEPTSNYILQNSLFRYLTNIETSYQVSQNPEHSSPDLLANETFSQFMLLSSLHPGQQQAVVQAVIGTLHVISPSNLSILLNKEIEVRKYFDHNQPI